MKTKVIDSRNGPLFHAMLHQRARTFGPHGLDWKVSVIDGEERDILDNAASPIYVVATDNDAVVGSLRLLPTTGPTLLDCSFPKLEPFSMESPEIWELSRLCTEGINRITVLLEMLNIVGDLAKKNGVTSIVAIMAINMLWFYQKKIKLPLEILGKDDNLFLVSFPIIDTHARVIELLK